MTQQTKTSGVFWREEIREFEIVISSITIGWCEDEGKAQNMYQENLRVQREHVERNSANKEMTNE